MLLDGRQRVLRRLLQLRILALGRFLLEGGDSLLVTLEAYLADVRIVEFLAFEAFSESSTAVSELSFGTVTPRGVAIFSCIVNLV